MFSVTTPTVRSISGSSEAMVGPSEVTFRKSHVPSSSTPTVFEVPIIPTAKSLFASCKDCKIGSLAVIIPAVT